MAKSNRCASTHHLCHERIKHHPLKLPVPHSSIVGNSNNRNVRLLYIFQNFVQNETPQTISSARKTWEAHFRPESNNCGGANCNASSSTTNCPSITGSLSRSDSCDPTRPYTSICGRMADIEYCAAESNILLGCVRLHYWASDRQQQCAFLSSGRW